MNTALGNAPDAATGQYAAAVGIKVTAHELRHTFVSLIADGMDIKTLQTILGHSKPEITLGLYKHMLEGSLERAADIAQRRGQGGRP